MPFWPKPGSERGPCDADCGHDSCRTVLSESRKICPICDKPIGFNVEFYSDGDVRTHAICTWKMNMGVIGVREH